MNAPIELLIEPRTHNLGTFEVGRILPFVRRRMIGPFIFLDHMGPAHFEIGSALDVLPHPHIGLSTVTYLFEGEIVHRDTLGSHQIIGAGAVNWMTAGRGIVHSERTAPHERAKPHALHGLQSWVGLPKEYEQIEPEFTHYAVDQLPEFTLRGAKVRLIAGEAYGYKSPVKILSPLFYAEIKMDAGVQFSLPEPYRERALYLIDGSLRIGTTVIASRTLPVFSPHNSTALEALMPSHFVILGGEPFTEPRYIDWNFVSSSQERILQAKHDWREQRFPKIPGDDKEYVPLPERNH